MGLSLSDKLWEALALTPPAIQYLIKGFHEELVKNEWII